MVDKLEKYGHRRIYYRLKTAVFVLLIALAVTAMMAIPVGISVRLSAEAGDNAVATASVLSAHLRMLIASLSH